MTSYDGTLSLRDARKRYFRDNAFGDDGGYAKKWVKVQLGPLPLAFPNSAARVRAVRYHDLHHVVTGYATNVAGEAEIGAWEIGSGCAGFVAAWILNLYAMVLGFLSCHSGAVWRAFLRGRRTRNLYRIAYDDVLLDSPLARTRAQLGLDAPIAQQTTTLAERAAFVGWSAVAIALALMTATLLLSPLWIFIRAVV
jgi:hypothetical protein